MGDIRDFYKQKRTCCMSIPLFQGGMMIILYFNAILALFAACMSCFGPKILALVQPTLVSYAFAVLYLATAAIQVFGIICVERNHISRFRIFKNLNLYAMAALLSLALVFIIVSTSQHTTSTAQCMKVYQFPVDANFKKKGYKDNSGISSAYHAAMTVCDIFSWIQVVVMGLVWFTLASTQIYFGSKHRVFYELKEPDYLEDTARV